MTADAAECRFFVCDCRYDFLVKNLHLKIQRDKNKGREKEYIHDTLPQIDMSFSRRIPMSWY